MQHRSIYAAYTSVCGTCGRCSICCLREAGRSRRQAGVAQAAERAGGGADRGGDHRIGPKVAFCSTQNSLFK